VAVKATAPAAVHLSQLLSSPPPLINLNASQHEMTHYTGIPATPPPRRNNKVDRQWYQAQRKMEQAMHMLVHSLEQPNPQNIQGIGAWIRSAWEDAHQARRQFQAGRQAHQLQPRQDDTQPQLLTAEEKEKIMRSRSRPRTRSQWGQESQPSQWGRPWEPKTSGKGKGKGKGKGRSQSKGTSQM
jgi:hypothetical protein